MEIRTAIQYLNHPIREIRFECVKVLSDALRDGRLPRVERLNECNNHVHSQYSFSPYTPSMIAWKAYQAGLSTCGIMDHESIEGCREFRDACRLFGIVPTIGFEIRMHWNNTSLRDRRFNNPDQKSIGYFPVHGVPISKLPEIERFLFLIRQERKRRNIQMTVNIDRILSNYGLNLDFEKDVIPVSKWIARGNITERHLLYATSKKLIEKYKPGSEIISFMQTRMGIELSESAQNYLMEVENPYYLFDVTNVLKGFFSEHMYVPASMHEAPAVEKTIPFLASLGCIPTYTYLGDVKKESVTGDKKPQKFEDEILDEMIGLLKSYGMRALSYAPRRNDAWQVQMVRNLCRKYEMMEVAGEDINQPRQPFLNSGLPRIMKNYFDKTTWAIIGHEIAAEEDLSQGIFSKEMCRKYPRLRDRLEIYEKIGKNSVR